MTKPSLPDLLGAGGEPARRPALSVVLVAVDRYETIKKTVTRLTVQTARDSIELVIVAPVQFARDLEREARSHFPASRVVALDAIHSASHARAVGVAEARAAVVAFAEDHSYPEPGWAAALIAAHEGPWCAVGPVIDNGNVPGIMSWASLFLNYGPWAAPAFERTGTAVEHLPGHNSSYKRGVLLEYGAQLGAMLEVESFLHWDLRARGHQLFLEPRARTRHVNVTTPAAFVGEHLLVGRMFGARRAEQWSVPRRALAALVTPLVPFRRMGGTVAEVRAAGREHQLLPWVIPLIFAGLTFRALGELRGVLFGAGDAGERLSRYEFNRMQYVSKRDRAADA